MQVRASARGLRMSPRKVQLVVRTIRGRPANEALAVLRFLPQSAARAVYKVIQSAMANAENNYSLDPAALRVANATADQGPSYPPRYRAKARGQAGVIKRRTTHLTVIVDDEPAPRRRQRTARPVTRRATRPAPSATE